jgi:peroxiredoxin
VSGMKSVSRRCGSCLSFAGPAVLMLVVSAHPGCKSSSPASVVDKQAADMFSEGGAAVPFVLQDAHDQQLQLSDFGDKLVLLNFWATWCVPCIEEMPAMQRVYEKYRQQGFEVVAINVNARSERKAALDFVKRQGLTFPVLFDPDQRVYTEYGVKELPESFVIAPGGRFAAVPNPKSGKTGVRVVSGQVWDSEAFQSVIQRLLPTGR